jgi:hypothetical protein
MTDKLWAQLIVPPVLTVVWLLIGSHILKLARPGGDLDKARSKLNGYGAAVMLVVMYVIWFHSELESHWKVWVVSFVVVAVFVAVIGASWREEGRLLNSDGTRALMIWVGANAAGLVIVSIFWYYGNLQRSLNGTQIGRDARGAC